MNQDDINKLFAEHGGLASAPVVVKGEEEIDNPNADLREIKPKVPNPNPVREYVFKDGTHMRMRWEPGNEDTVFQVTDPGTALKSPTQPAAGDTSRFPVTTYNPDGSQTVTQWGKDPKTGVWGPIEGIPPENKPSTTKAPSQPSDWQSIRENPQDPNSRVVAIMDPRTGERQTVSAGATPAKPTLIQGQGGELISWDGTTVKTLREAKPAAKIGDTQDTFETINGQTYNVTQRYDGTGWKTIKIGDKAPLSGQAADGATRQNIQGGRHVTETYQNGDWRVTDVGASAVPEKPTAFNMPSDQLTYSTMDSEGRISTSSSPNFVAKNRGDVAARANQINGIAQAKQAELLGKVGANYSREQAVSDFNGWYDQNVAPQVGALKGAQEQIAIQEEKDRIASRTAANTSALGAGTQALAAYNDYVKTHVGPGFGAAEQALSRGDYAGFGKINDSAVFKGPNPIDMAQQATQNALKYIDSSSAQAAGVQPANLGQLDPTALLGRDRYALGGGAPLPAPPAAAAPAAPAQDPNWGADLMSRQAQDAELQRLQAGITLPQQNLLPPGSAGMPGMDPRLTGRLNPNLFDLYNDPNNPLASNYVYGGV